MKTKLFSLCCLLALTLFFSCDKQVPNPDCVYSDCETMYEQIRAEYQAEANRKQGLHTFVFRLHLLP